MAEKFLEAVRKGQRAALAAEKKIGEIRAVIADLDSQIRRLSGESVGVVESPRPAVPKNFVPSLSKGFEPPPRRYNALVFKREGEEREFCEFERGPGGYPVEIRYDGGFTLASNRVELVAALKDVLATSQAGRALNALLNPEPARQAG